MFPYQVLNEVFKDVGLALGALYLRDLTIENQKLQVILDAVFAEDVTAGFNHDHEVSFFVY